MTLEDYLNLIPSQHRQKPRFIAVLTALLRPLCDLEDTLREMRASFDLDSAAGRQLDAVGVRVGRGRYLHTPLEGVYFCWDTAGVGWNEGVWKGKYDPASGLTELPDDLYRMLLKAKVAANRWDGSVSGAYEAWEIAFAGQAGLILILDNQDMSMTVGIAGIPLTPVFEQLLLQGYLPLKPEGVRVNWYAVTPEGGPLFAWNCDSPALAGWNEGCWPKKLTPVNLWYDMVPDDGPYFGWNVETAALVGWNEGRRPSVLTATQNDGLTYRRV